MANRFIFPLVVAMWCAALRQTGYVAAFSTFKSSTRRSAFPTTSRAVLSMSTTSATEIIPRVKAADAKEPSDGPVLVKGWVRTVRKQKTLAFVEVNDGSNLGGIQCVLSFDVLDEDSQAGKATHRSTRN
jgi:hypothetical protein